MEKKKIQTQIRWYILLIFICFFIAGCDGETDGEYIISDGYCDRGCSSVSGTAYFPFYDCDAPPCYYENENHDIRVRLYDEWGFPVGEELTGRSGYFEFTGIDEGWYYLEAEVFSGCYGWVDVYYTDTGLFFVGAEEHLYDMLLFPEYAYTESCT